MLSCRASLRVQVGAWGIVHLAQMSSFRPDCLRGRVVLVTGGGSGICKGIARRFLEAGCDVAILSRTRAKLESSAKQLEQDAPGTRCLPVVADVRDYKQMERAVGHVLKEFGRIDILVNGAAGNFLCPPERLTPRGFKSVMDIDAYGTFYTSQIVFNEAFSKQAPLPTSVSAQSPRGKTLAINGIILNISMTLHHSGHLFQTHAGAAKAAIDAMTKHLAVEWGPRGVRVVGVAPGPIADTVGLQRLSDYQSLRSQPDPSGSTTSDVTSAEDLIPLQRLGTVDEIADICLFLCLPEAAYITGTTIVADGGQVLAAGNVPLFFKEIRDSWKSGTASKL